MDVSKRYANFPLKKRVECIYFPINGFAPLFQTYKWERQLSESSFCRIKVWEPVQWRTHEKISGVQGYGRPRRGCGGGALLRPENFRKFAKNSLRKLQNCRVFAFLQKISKPCVKFSRVRTKNKVGWGNFEKIMKIFDENSIEKLNFYLFWENFWLKIEPSEITSFYPAIFPVRGGVELP